MAIFDELKKRGLIAQTTGEDAVKELINNGKAVFYTGFDPTADSLHVGHFLPLILMRHLQQAGNTPIALIGGGTTMVGDPSGRTDLRKVMTFEQIDVNAQKFKVQISKFIDFSDGKAHMLNNAGWLMGLNYVKFLRDIGVHFSVNRMLAAECFKSRYEQGLSFIEFNYMLMQAFDFFHLHQTLGCNMQCGGDDQWGNMLAGTELIRRKLGKDSNVMTIPLLLTSDGKKMGKTAKGALWLDAEKTSPFDFYQYFRNVLDDDAVPFLKRLTFVPLDEIDSEYANLSGQELNRAKERLALELTTLIHGEKAANEAAEAAKSLFGAGAANDNMPSHTLTADVVGDGIAVTDLLVACGLTPSKGEARRVIEQGGLVINDKKIDSLNAVFTVNDIKAGMVIRKGKKTFIRVEIIG
ncbi:MAG: tyrosine--tRNA ligase [Oscillospiraceae bacterium]|nr:tyrosine--tRNA ligase [Oscillospiraceae bacterium]